VALPIYLASIFGWSHSVVGAFLAAWVIAYGFVQGFAPKITPFLLKKAARRTVKALYSGVRY